MSVGWLRARSADGVITSDVLHVPIATWNQGRGWASSHATPLCDQSTAGRWELTGPWREGWQRHAHWPVCARCTRKLDELQQLVDAQQQLVIDKLRDELTTARQTLERELEHTDPPPTTTDAGEPHHRSEATS